MEKAEMLEEIRCELSLLVENVKEKKEWYHSVIAKLKSKVPHYQSIVVYLTDDNSFYYYDHCSNQDEEYRMKIPLGEEFLSIVAARAEISCEFVPAGQRIYIPFYQGHHLMGEFVIKTSQYVDDDEVKFMKNIQNILNVAPF